MNAINIIILIIKDKTRVNNLSWILLITAKTVGTITYKKC